jgi:diguanylate cyclase (GGDEF)-like protein
LFLPDLRQPLDLEDVDVIVVGKDKTSLSWIGVPLTSNRFKGMLALASYQPNAFNRGDIELLANLAQHTAMALENAANHAEVQDRTRRDSLTGVLNHGYFLETLQNVLEEAASFNSPVSVIMLDVDYFKQYNDTYGHLIGDKVLLQLCETIRAHIKTIDSVGRWGGEEFIITLPGAAGVSSGRAHPKDHARIKNPRTRRPGTSRAHGQPGGGGVSLRANGDV